MATGKNTQYFVLNSVAASAADLSTPGQGRVLVTGDTEGFNRGNSKDISVNKFITETLQVETITATATPAAGTTYSFVIEQEAGVDPNEPISRVYGEYYAPVGVTAALLGAAFTAIVQGAIDSGQLNATAAVITSGNGGVTVTALTGSPVMRYKQGINVTFTSTLASGSSTSTDFSGVAATGVITMEVAATTGMAVGQLHELSAWTGGETINGHTAAAIVRVSALLTTPARVQYIATLSADFTGQDSDYQLLSSNQTGLGSDLTADRGITGGGNPNVDIVAANIYHEVVVSGGEASGSTQTAKNFAPFEKHYFINSGDADALDLLARFVEVDNYYVAGGTTADPALNGNG